MKKIFLTILVSGIVFSCDDRLEELNRPRKDPVEVPGPPLFSSGLRNMVDMMVSTDVNENVFRLYAQYWAQTTYPDESRYNMVSREIPDIFWRNAYRDALQDLDQARQIIEQEPTLPEAEKNNQIAIIDICRAYVYSVLVDVFGAVPFSQALDEENLLPEYESGAEVYDQVIEMLNNSVAAIDEEAPGFSANQDLLYEGDVEAWKKFANSWKLRLALNLAEVDPGRAQTMITEALNDTVFQSNADNASMTYYATPPNTNPLWVDLVQSGRDDYVVSNTLVDIMLSLDDPRLSLYAEPVEDGMFVGGEYGTANSFADNSHIGEIFHDPELEGIILDYAQVEFLLAEAAARGFTVPGIAEEHYHAGIRASMEYWGIEEADITAYLAQPEVNYSTAIAGSDWSQVIGIQEWLSLYNRGFAGWTVWRRLDFEGFNTPEGLEPEDIPKRLIFPIEEATLNPTNLQEAIQLIGGADNAQTRVFWDVSTD